MERRSMKSSLSRAMTLVAAVALLGSGTLALAQDPEAAPAPTPQDSQQRPADQPVLSAAQLDNLVAPLALYPDPLLSQVLVACTYPLEVVEAQQWLERNKSLRSDQLMDAAKQQNWDASVQALVAFPDLLTWLNKDIRWTTDVGNAFLAQQPDVMSAVQRMRARAKDSGKLNTTPQQTVTTETQGDQTAISIQPADPQVIYVPVYDPAYIWGPPLWGYYPPLYYPTYGFGFGYGIRMGFFFGGGWGGWGGWGWGPSWFGRSVVVNNYFFNHYGYRPGPHGAWGGPGTGAWMHNPWHRVGVPYSNPQIANRFGGAVRPMTPGMRNGFAASPGMRMGGQGFASRPMGGAPPRMAAPSIAPRMSAPAPRMSAPAPRMSSPAPRMGGMGGGGGFHGGGGGFHGGGGGGHRGR